MFFRFEFLLQTCFVSLQPVVDFSLRNLHQLVRKTFFYYYRIFCFVFIIYPGPVPFSIFLLSYVLFSFISSSFLVRHISGCYFWDLLIPLNAHVFIFFSPSFFILPSILIYYPGFFFYMYSLGEYVTVSLTSFAPAYIYSFTSIGIYFNYLFTLFVSFLRFCSLDSLGMVFWSLIFFIDSWKVYLKESSVNELKHEMLKALQSYSPVQYQCWYNRTGITLFLFCCINIDIVLGYMIAKLSTFHVSTRLQSSLLSILFTIYLSTYFKHLEVRTLPLH